MTQVIRSSENVNNLNAFPKSESKDVNGLNAHMPNPIFDL